jgi:hypothetical protein
MVKQYHKCMCIKSVTPTPVISLFMAACFSCSCKPSAGLLYTFIQEMYTVLRWISPLSTQSPFLPCMSWCAQYVRWTSFGRRVWFTESHIVLVIFSLLVVLFILFILDIKKSCCFPVKQLNHFFSKITQSLHLYFLTHVALVHDCFLTGLLASVVRR